ncbi:MAG: hypothetical protein R3C56_41315 [Pirellulaceae bacterium]
MRPLNQRGTLDVLRHGFDMLGLQEELKLAQFKPALAINPDILTLRGQSPRVVRQVHYSQHNQNSIDLVLFLNGIPLPRWSSRQTSRRRLKTRSINTGMIAILPQGQNPEPLLSFPGGALVHFAVSNREVHGPRGWPVRQRRSCRSIWATTEPLAIHSPRADIAHRIYGAMFGNATVGWKYWAATSWPSVTTRNN